jgi:processive 1,2-diacylglycerol beta-glucosyltransferase
MRYLGILNPNIKIGWQHTDYVDSKVFANLSRRIDMTFLPHSGLKKSWVELYGVSSNQVLATGISVNPDLAESLTPEARALFLESKGLKANVRTIVLMSGVNAVGDFPTILRSISEGTNDPVQIVAICGKNADQLAAIQTLSLPSNAILKAEGFTKPEDVGKYFKSADVIVTKAGGLSSAEIFTIGKPTVLLDINGGQERYNIHYFEKYRLAKGVRDQTKVGSAVAEAVTEATDFSALIERQRAFASERDVKSPGEWVTEQVAEMKRKYPNGVPVLLPTRPTRFRRCLENLKEPFLFNI